MRPGARLGVDVGDVRIGVASSDPSGLLAALDGYRNPDGGYGWGLEPDLRTPESQPGAALHAQGSWSIQTLAGSAAPPAAAELARFVVTPRAIQAMLRGSGVTVGRFRPSIHVTLWS